MPTKKNNNESNPKRADGPYSDYPQPDAEATCGATECEIAALAYELWQERGCGHGQDLEDWNRAVEIMSRGGQMKISAPPEGGAPGPAAEE